MEYFDVKGLAQEILDEVKSAPTKKALLIVAVGANSASESYIKGKIKDCEYCGVPYAIARPETIHELILTVEDANQDPRVGGIIIQLPLPEGWDEDFFVRMVLDAKDVDGFKPSSRFAPCTPEGIIEVMKHYWGVGTFKGKRVLVIGRGKLVGEPLREMLIDLDATVEVAHSKSGDLVPLLKGRDAIVLATGKPGLVKPMDIDDGTLVIDAGVTKVDGKLCGDLMKVDGATSKICATPVPGGIGLMTRAMLMKHMKEVNE